MIGLAAAVWPHGRPLATKGTIQAYGYMPGALAATALVLLVTAIPDGIEIVTNIDEQVVGLLLVTALIMGAAFHADYQRTYSF